MVTYERGRVCIGAGLEVHRDQDSLGVCRLGPETVACAEECGGVCLNMRTEELPPNTQRPHWGRPLPESLQSSRERMVGGNQSRGRTRLCVRRRSAYGESGGAAGAILHIPGPPHAPGPGGDAAPGARVLSNRALQFSLTVPFSSHAEADIARHFLTPRTQLQGPIRKELNVNGRMLVLRLTAEDPGLLQRSIAFCLEQLSLVMRSLQHFVAPVSAKPQHGRGV
ncbi:EKC/KEOPS complex subunit LAGE3-like isoform X2 [Cervus elaphus]|uniref:EKC/KEOPS complex subunit LAGE3-like isoform X2 n=1 Tax=Cervus canadensis TaxID=1574408 RepID=UPI0018BE3AFF|nr:EKC/KEOPS complex subunit LAGE3-like isoform X2 [Cervus canadensis]XP_043752311.1 EKC/KEOPS complex subunit LAGE3-like isoform X2 [Cervus elaphus]